MTMLAAYFAMSRFPGVFGLDYSVAVGPWHEAVVMGFAYAQMGVAAILVASYWFTFPRWTGRLCIGLTICIAALVIADFHQVLAAHLHASAIGPREPMLLANQDGCGRTFNKRPRKGPCSHIFGMMGSNGRLLTARGYGMAYVRSCALAQRMEDGSGFVWYRIMAQRSVLPDLNGLSGFSREVANACFSGQLTARFEIL